MKQVKIFFTLSILLLVLALSSCGLSEKSQSNQVNADETETINPPLARDDASSEATDLVAHTQSATITEPGAAINKNGLKSFSFPGPVGYVNDFERILASEEIKTLAEMMGSHERETTDQIAIITVTSIGPYESLDAYSLALANHWGVGQKGKDNGVLIAFSRELREVGIQNGYGIEKRMTDAETKDIIDNVMTPNFAKGNYFDGFKKGVQAIIDKLH